MLQPEFILITLLLLLSTVVIITTNAFGLTAQLLAAFFPRPAPVRCVAPVIVRVEQVTWTAGLLTLLFH